MPPAERQTAWYQQDGATPHSTRVVGDLLELMFEGRWLANKGPYRWPARSPDLTVLDFFVWGFIKNIVFMEPVTTKENMQERVQAAFDSLTPEVISEATNHGVLRRVNKCLEQNGNVFEHLLE